MKLRVALIGLFLFALPQIANPRPVCALPACELERVYYSDDSFTNVVADYYVSCSSGVHRSGHSTYYYDHIEYGDCGNGQGTCGGVNFRCSNGTTIDASDPRYIGQHCG